MNRINREIPGCTVVCKLMPLYRLGVFRELSVRNDIAFTFLGDTKKQGGIESISFDVANKETGGKWIKTKNYFYKPELLLWQTGVLKRILVSKDKVFIFEGAVSHLPYWIFPVICKLMGKKVLFWTHGFRGTDKGIKKLIRKFFFKRLANGLLLYSNYSKELMMNDGLKERNLTVIYNSLNSLNEAETFPGAQTHDAITENSEAIFREPGLFTIVFIGRLVNSKRVMSILETVLALKKNEVFVNAIIIGSGPEREILEEFCRNNHLRENVHFTGSLYNEKDIAKYFQMSDLMVSPGNVGLNCIHALSYGIPVSTHNDMRFQGPEAEAITEHRNGFFFQRDNNTDLYNKLRSWILEGKNKEEIAAHCRKVVLEKYNPGNQAKLISEAVKKII